MFSMKLSTHTCVVTHISQSNLSCNNLDQRGRCRKRQFSFFYLIKTLICGAARNLDILFANLHLDIIWLLIFQLRKVEVWIIFALKLVFHFHITPRLATSSWAQLMDRHKKLLRLEATTIMRPWIPFLNCFTLLCRTRLVDGHSLNIFDRANTVLLISVKRSWALTEHAIENR